MKEKKISILILFLKITEEGSRGKEENANYRKIFLDGLFAIANEHFSSSSTKSP